MLKETNMLKEKPKEQHPNNFALCLPAPNTDRSVDSFSQGDSGRLRDPSILRSQQVTMGRTPEGHPVMTTTTYTRMEASLPDDAQVSQRSASVRNRVSR